MFKLYVTLLLAVEVAGLAVLSLLVPGIPVLLLAPVIPLTLLVALIGRRSLRMWNTPSRRTRRLSPEQITDYEPGETSSPASPEELSDAIVERAAEIRRALQAGPSEVEVEMCAIGYRACVNDMITLTHLANEQLPNATFTRRLKLRRARSRATDALAAARQTLPPGALRPTRQERS